jgi:hypothetical protein
MTETIKNKGVQNRLPKPFVKSILIAIMAVFFVWFFGYQPGMGQKQDPIPWSVETHDRTNFPLTGRHRTVSCRDCHLNNVFEGTPTSCEVCHWERRQDDRYSLNLGSHCSDCHNTFDWKNVAPNKWNHLDVSAYKLEGRHRILDCLECHEEGTFVGTTTECYSCHSDDYAGASDPDHMAAGFSTQCQTCHIDVKSWKGAIFIHDKFYLKGMHKIASCSDCHRGGKYAGIPSTCFSCHQQDYNNARDPDHRQKNFPMECYICHGTDADNWEGAEYSHTGFPLRGKHRTIPCADCHSGGQSENLPSDCVFCHLDDYINAQNPNHKDLGFHTNCEVCHGTDAVSWTKTTFSHNSYWSLSMPHADLNCMDCHRKGRQLLRDCYNCHKKEFDSATNPRHKDTGFPTSCESCHFSSHVSWTQAVFTHQFPIKSGKHSHLDCTECHVSAVYKDFSCLNCHAHEKSRMDREHKDIAGYSFNSQACYACHFMGRK